MPNSWETRIVQLLDELSSVQHEVFELLDEKRELLRTFDGAGLTAMIPREEALIERLQRCHEQRVSLLAQASGEGLPADSLRSLSTALPRSQRLTLAPQIDAAASRAQIAAPSQFDKLDGRAAYLAPFISDDRDYRYRRTTSADI